MEWFVTRQIWKIAETSSVNTLALGMYYIDGLCRRFVWGGERKFVKKGVRN